MDLLTAARAELARVEAEREQVRAQYRDEMAEFDFEVRRLNSVVRTLTGEKQPRRKRTPAAQVGTKALAAVRAALAEGPLPQAQIVKATGLNDGTVSYALRALVQSSEIEATGERVNGSREFRLRGRARSAA